MALNPIDERYTTNRFEITIDGTVIDNIQSVGGFTQEFEVPEENQAGIGPKRVRAGRMNPPDITISRLYGDDRFLSDWMAENVEAVGTVRKDGTIYLLDRSGAPVGEWEIRNCFPIDWGVSDLSAETDDPMTEDVTLACEELVRIS